MPESTQDKFTPNADTGIPDGINLAEFTKSLIGDLNGLRSGRVSIQQGRAIAELARQIIRSMHLVVSAQRLIESRAKPINTGEKDGKETN